MKLLSILILFTTAAAVIQQPSLPDRKPLGEVNVTDLMDELTAGFPEANSSHLAQVILWNPIYWEISGIQENVDFLSLMPWLKDKCLVIVAQADIGIFGNATWYSSEKIKKNLALTYYNQSGQRKALPIKRALEHGDEAELVEIIKGILVEMLGPMGEACEIYYCENAMEAYLPGKLEIQVGTTENILLRDNLSFPLDSLFIPRKCPNGKDAHVSWNYCPWSGSKLSE
jgi:hypothetical protein